MQMAVGMIISEGFPISQSGFERICSFSKDGILYVWILCFGSTHPTQDANLKMFHKSSSDDCILGEGVNPKIGYPP